MSFTSKGIVFGYENSYEIFTKIHSLNPTMAEPYRKAKSTAYNLEPIHLNATIGKKSN